MPTFKYNKIPDFLKRDGDSLLFNQDGEFVFYVPEIYFDRGDALIKGEYVNLLGVLDYSIFKPNGSNIGLKRFYFPTVFLCKPSRIEKVKKIRLKDTTDVSDYRLLIFEKGDAVVVSVFTPQNISNVEDFFRIFLTGKLPTTIPYDKFHEYFPESIQLNGASFNMNLQMFGIIASEVCRAKNDPSKAFRHTKIKNMTDYATISIKDLPKYISPNTSIASENWDLGVIGAVMNDRETNSPLEKLIMGNS